MKIRMAVYWVITVLAALPLVGGLLPQRVEQEAGPATASDGDHGNAMVIGGKGT